MARRSVASVVRPIAVAESSVGMTRSPRSLTCIEYGTWLDALPDNQRDSAIGEALQAVCDLDLGELQAIEPPRGLGRDGATGWPKRYGSRRRAQRRGGN